MLLPLFFFFLFLLNFHLSSSISFPDFQIIDVLRPHLANFNNTHFAAESKYTFRLLHRDRFPSVIYRNHHHRLHARMRRDTERVAAIVRRISGKTVASNSKYQVDDFRSNVVSGMDQGSGEYFVRIGVGSPPRDQYMVIDSGSDMVWVRCQPCKLYYKQSDSVSDPAKSGSYTGVSCGSSVYDRIENSGCNSGGCRYEVMYGDGSYAKGTLALETLTFSRTVVRNVAMGCGHRNKGMFIGKKNGGEKEKKKIGWGWFDLGLCY